MSDSVSQTAISGTVSPRNIDTVVYRVVRPLPSNGLPSPGAEMRVWPQGESYVNINGGLRPITMAQVEEWRAAGLIELWTKEPAKPAAKAAE